MKEHIHKKNEGDNDEDMFLLFLPSKHSTSSRVRTFKDVRVF